VIQPEDIVEGEWADWYRLTPLESWHQSQKLCAAYLAMGGPLDTEPIHKVLSKLAARRVRAQLMGGQACVF
jgi:hypothetical protein